MSKPIPISESFQPFENTPIPIDAIAFQHLASKPNHKIYSVSLRGIEQSLKPKIKTHPATVLPGHYKEFLKVFSHEEANKLPARRPGVDCTIKMQPGTQCKTGNQVFSWKRQRGLDIIVYNNVILLICQMTKPPDSLNVLKLFLRRLLVESITNDLLEAISTYLYSP